MSSNSEQELKALAESLPDLKLEFDKKDKSIIHIIDRRLLRQTHYPLNSIVERVKFEGTFFDFVDFLSTKGLLISPRGMIDTHEGLGLDMGLNVHVDAVQQSTRHLLTHSVPLNDNSRILWIARTELGANSITYVQSRK